MTADAKQPDLPPAKRDQILAGAKDVFRALGFERASVDAIAAKAGVSKATLYNHFKSKEALFLSTFGAETTTLREKFHSLLETPTGDLEADLHLIGEQLLRLVCSQSNVQRQRVVIAEVDRFPGIGRSLYECSVKVGQASLARFMERAASEGLLEIHAPLDAAIDFSSLCVSELSRLILLGVEAEVTEELIAQNVGRGVRTFLRAYAPR